jgi:hypothetical protein
MFVHVNPEADSHSESLSTCYFAQRTATVSLGASKANVETGELLGLSASLATMTTSLTKSQAALQQRETEIQRLKHGQVRGRSEYQCHQILPVCMTGPFSILFVICPYYKCIQILRVTVQ